MYYEVVNTSAPEGLLPGSRGFSTVMATKGMPDSARVQVEGLCSYPHRESARGAEYWTANPVNWFHLVLPGGAHAAGCTSPAEFDYTGRTNRLAHAFFFPQGEMPSGGGARVLGCLQDKLTAGWNGETAWFEPPSREEAVKLRFNAARGKEGRPSTWIEMFGARGEEYARRFAALLAKNIDGDGRPIYFKAGAQDMDGARLFNLFYELIDLLPLEKAALAAFSTFSACVPGGMQCHLRGIFDTNRAFAAASATMPWVDCENNRVVNEELLPPPVASGTVPARAAGAVSGTGLQSVVNIKNGQDTRSTYGVSPRLTTISVSANSPRRRAKADALFTPVQMIVIVLCIAAIVSSGAWFFAGKHIRANPAPNDNRIITKETENPSPPPATTPRSNGTSKTIEDCETQNLVESKTTSEKDKKSPRPLEGQEIPSGGNGHDARSTHGGGNGHDAHSTHDGGKHNGDGAHTPTKKAKDENGLPSHSEIKIFKVVKSWENELEGKKDKFTKPGDIVFYAISNNVLNRTEACYKSKSLANETTWICQPRPDGNSRWLAVWLTKEKTLYLRCKGLCNESLFSGSDDKADLDKLVFGGSKHAEYFRTLAKKKDQMLAYVAICADKKIYVSREFDLSWLKLDQKEINELDKEIEDRETKNKNIDEAIKELNRKIDKYREEKRKEQFSGTSKVEEEAYEILKRYKLLDVLEKRGKWYEKLIEDKGGKRLKLEGLKPDDLKRLKNNSQTDISKLKSKKKVLENWEDNYRKSTFEVQVELIDDKDDKGREIKSDLKKGYSIMANAGNRQGGGQGEEAFQ